MTENIYPIEQFITYDRATGMVLSSGTSQEPLRMVTDTVDVLIGKQGKPGMSYVSLDEVIDCPPKPSPGHVFDWGAKRWQLDTDLAWSLVKMERNKRLVSCDWTQLPDVPSPTKAAWADYRQQLRDITLQLDPQNITWPELPI